MFSSRVTPDSYHPTLSLRDNLTVCFHLWGNITFWLTLRAFFVHTEISDNSTGLLHPHRNFGFLHGSLTPSQKFGTSPLVSYTYTEIWDLSPGLLHPYRNSGSLPRSLTPTQKFGISHQVSYTHTEIRDLSPCLLHPHRNSASLPGSLTPTHKFGISPRVSYTHTKIRDISPSLLHPYRTFRILPQVSFTLTPGFSPEGINNPLLDLPNTL